MAKVLDSYSALSNLKGKSETKNLERKLSAAEEGTVVDDSTLSSTVQKRTKATTFYDLYTSYLTFRDSEVKKNYKKFKIAQQSAGMFLILHLYLVITQVVGQLEIQGGNVDGLLIVNAVVAILFPFLLGSALAIINYLMISDKNLLSSRSVIILHSVWVIGTTISFALSLIVSEVHHGSCANTASLACKDHDPEHFSETLMIITTLIPFILSLIAKGSEWNVTILSWVIAFTTVLVLLSTYDKNEITSTFLIFLPLSLIFGLEIRRQNLSEYLIFQQLQELLATRERESDEKYALEMRHMIGNVAHDLKTVSCPSTLIYYFLFFNFTFSD